MIWLLVCAYFVRFKLFLIFYAVLKNMVDFILLLFEVVLSDLEREKKQIAWNRGIVVRSIKWMGTDWTSWDFGSQH